MTRHAPLRRGLDGVFFSRPYLGTDRVTGRRIRPYRSFPEARDEAEAQRMADEWLASVAPAVAGVGRELSSMLADWVDGREATGAPGNTVASYRYACRLLGPTLGRVAFDRVRPADVAGALRELMARGGMRGEGVSAATATQVRAVLSSAYADWQREGLVGSNPVSGVSAPTPASVRAAMAMAEADYADLYALVTSEMRDGATASRRMVAAGCWVSLVTGMRRGEVLALRTRDWSPVLGELAVSGTVVARPRLMRQPKPKSRSGVRSVPLPRGDAQVLEELMAWRDGWPVWGGTRRADRPVVCDPSGGLMHPDQLSGGFKALAREAGVEGVTFHSLRHTYASWMIAGGTDARTVQEIMGHADVRTTLQLYGHLLPGQKRAAAESLGEVRGRFGACQ